MAGYLPEEARITGSARERALEAFSREYGRAAEVLARAPGRVNLIGEHTDYNDGFVLPVAIDRAVYIAAASRSDEQVELLALDFEERSRFPLSDITHDPEHPWSDYPRGMAWVLREKGLPLVGMRAVISGDVPIGAGLSSSAAIEVATAKALQVLSGFELGDVALALAAQEAENRFVGMQCGIMDQFISVLGRKGQALLVDCRSLEHRLVPIPEGCSVVVANTMKRRGLVDSEYNRRRSECEEGVRLLRRHLPDVQALRDVSLEDLEGFGDELPPGVRKRCRHVVTENARVLAGVEALQSGDAARFGELMLASHASLRDDYQVSCPELDVMVEAALGIEGLYGARMTGAGFGGCTVNLVRAARARAFAESLAAEYRNRLGIEPEIYVCSVEDGAQAERLRPT